jgi:hypothetical protein
VLKKDGGGYYLNEKDYDFLHRAEVAEVAFELFLQEYESIIPDPIVDRFYKQAAELKGGAE